MPKENYILVIEDDTQHQKNITTALHAAGYKTLVAENSDAAEKICKTVNKEQIILIVLDSQLTRLGTSDLFEKGIDVLAELYMLDLIDAVPTIAHSSDFWLNKELMEHHMVKTSVQKLPKPDLLIIEIKKLLKE